MSNAPKSEGTYQLITPPNELKARVGGGVGIDSVLAERADSAVQNLQGEFVAGVTTAIEDIIEQISLAESAAEGDDVFTSEIFRISHDMHMQGVAFGYQLISDICGSLCGYIDNLSSPEDLADQIVGAHTDALRSVIGNAIVGDGGALGRELVESLNALIARA